MSASVSEAREAVAVGTYAGLSLRYRVSTSSPDLAAEFARLYASCAVPDPEEHASLSIELHDGARGWQLQLDDTSEVHATDRNGLLLATVTEIDRATVLASTCDALLLHASTVLTADGPVLLVGASGAGKSTLAAALTAQGWPYIGDEVVGLDENAEQLRANPKPWKLDRRSRSALAEFSGSDAFALDTTDDEVLVAPLDVGSVSGLGPAGCPAAIVRVVFREGAKTNVSPLSRADAAELLADQCFNFAQWGARALETVAALARRVPALQLEFGDLPSAVAALAEARR